MYRSATENLEEIFRVSRPKNGGQNVCYCFAAAYKEMGINGRQPCNHSQICAAAAVTLTCPLGVPSFVVLPHTCPYFSSRSFCTVAPAIWNYLHSSILSSGQLGNSSPNLAINVLKPICFNPLSTNSVFPKKIQTIYMSLRLHK